MRPSAEEAHSTREGIFEVANCDRTQDLAAPHSRTRAVPLPQRFADFADGSVGAYGVDDIRHGVDAGNVAVAARGGSLGGGPLQRIKPALHFFIRSAGAQGA